MPADGAAAASGDGYYYDNDDAFNFYLELWGGENLHVGIYDGTEKVCPEECGKASDKALEKLLAYCTPALSGDGKRAMDMGSAYGGCARAMVKKFGCDVVCIDLSAKENALNREKSAAAGLEAKIIIPGELSFDDTKEAAGTCDCVVSEESILHAGDAREAVVAEAARVLKKGGRFVFSDLMETDFVDVSKLDKVYKRIGLKDMGSPAKYIQWATKAGLRLRWYEDHSEQVAAHYGFIKSILEQPETRARLKGKVSDGYIEQMLVGLQAWVDASKANQLTWGFFVFEKL